MKPLNESEPGCNFTTSNCVIWQGPNIACINLCKGDTVSDVTFKLATKICEILHTLNIDTYDLSCFNLTSCKPTDFEQLLQFLLERICKLESCTGCIPNCAGDSVSPNLPTTSVNGCPDCIVPIAECFYFNNSVGDQVTAMQLKDYLILIGNTLCDYFATVGYLQKTVSNLSFRVEALEVAPPAIYVPPTVTPSCVLPAVPAEMDDVLSALELQFCALRGSTGLPNSLYQSISAQPTALNSELQLKGNGAVMSALIGWKSSVTSVADSITNMWLTVLDMRQAIKNIQLNCCLTGCAGISLGLTAILDGESLTFYISGTIPSGFLECGPAGSIIKVTDSAGGSAQFPFSMLPSLNAPAGVYLNLAPTPINATLDLTLEILPCLINSTTGVTCESSLDYFLSNSALCPDMVYSQTQSTISYSFTSSVGPYTYSVQLWNNAGTTLISSQIINSPSSTSENGTFIGLGSGTNYKLRVTVVATGCPACTPISCPFQTIATSPQPCLPPSNVTSIFNAPLIYLGTACGFAVLAGTTIANTGSTLINGNLGLHSGSSITGGPVVTGTTQVNTPLAINAKTDLVSAYNQASAVPMTTDMSGINLGGQTLTPGVYFFSSSAAITGTLTLNGAGTYIFQIGTALVTDGGIDVVLTGGATADQVFWQIGSSATLGTNTVFKGIVMALTSISVNGGTVNGALMARNGAVTFTAGTTINYLGC